MNTNSIAKADTTLQVADHSASNWASVLRAMKALLERQLRGVRPFLGEFS